MRDGRSYLIQRSSAGKELNVCEPLELSNINGLFIRYRGPFFKP